MSGSELELVQKVDLRLALAESETQLETALASFLPPLLLKLASTDANVRQAVFSTVKNVFPRITAARGLCLPVKQLLDQAKAPQVPSGADPASVRLYSLLFLAKGIERLSTEEQMELVPEVIHGIGSAPVAAAARLFNIFLKLLQGWTAPESGSPAYESMRQRLKFDENDADERFLTQKMANFFLLQPNVNPHPIQCPGLGVADAAFFTTDAGVAYKTYDELTGVKKRLLEFLKVGFADKHLAVPLLVASTDSLTAIAETAHARFKKLDFDENSTDFIETLVHLYLGSPPTVPPVKPQLQDRILGVLCKSTRIVSHEKITEISNMGLSSEYARLRQTAVAFVRKVTSADPVMGPSTNVFNVSVAARLKEGISAEGWPQMDTSCITNYRAAITSRELQYEALGDVLRNAPSLWQHDLTYYRFLFESLAGEVPDLVPSLQSVLSGLSIHLPKLSEACKADLKSYLKNVLLSEGPGNAAACKYLAVKHVTCTYPFSDAEARLLCVLGTIKENSLETREEAERGLHPYHFNMLRASNTADYTSSREYLGHESEAEFPAFAEMVAATESALQNEPIFKKAAARAIKFTLSVLVMQAVRGKSTVVAIDEDWDRRLDKALEVDEEVRHLMIAELETLSKTGDVAMHNGEDTAPSAVLKFLRLVFDGIYSQLFESSFSKPEHVSGSVFALLISLSPSAIVGELSSTIPSQVQILQEKTLLPGDLRALSKTLSIIATHENNNISVALDIVAAFSKNIQSTSDKEKYISVIGHIFAKLALRSRIERCHTAAFEQYLSVVQDSISDIRLYDTCLDALSQLAIFGALGPQLHISTEVTCHLEKFIAVIESKLKSFHENSVLALSKLALASASTYDTHNSELLPIEQKVFDCHTSKQIEFVFTCGDALVVLAGGWSSKLLRQSLDVPGQAIGYMQDSTGRLGPILRHVLLATAQSKPALRRAGCIWLLALVQHLPHDPLIRESATEIHTAFMRFLADRDEMVQDAAARGLSLVYELGDADLKETLVKGLLRSFTDNNAATSLSSGSVDLDTQLFDKGVLKTHDSSVSTYKDVLSLAADVGDPGLVYKFMSMAKSNLLWTSRRGMAYGLGAIMSKASLAEMLTQNPRLGSRLIPKLYRYRHDPNTAVASAMDGIWASLVGDSPRVISDHFDDILREVLAGLGDREWRVRQASAVALNNLLQTQQLERYEARLDEIWNMSFRAMDDIKESVRKEGQALSKTLARTLIRSADLKSGTTGPISVQNGSKSAKILDKLIPLFMGTKGLLSDVEDVRNFALETVLRLCETGGLAIRKHVPELISHFIELMSTLEPEVVNYLVLNADKYNLDSNAVDAQRLQSVGHSPMMDAIEKLMAQIDVNVMPEVVRCLKSAVARAVGLPSKVCGSRVIVGLVTGKTALARDFGDALLAICVAQLGDRNTAVAHSYAVAAGHCCRLASVDAIVDYSKKIQHMYLTGEDPKTRKLAAVASEAVGRHGGADQFERVAAAFLPLAYIGKHDGDADVAKAFDKEWVEYASGASAVRLYFHEIFTICDASIRSHDYTVRQTMARTIVDVCTALDSLSPAEILPLFNTVLEACKGKSWQGKELVFEALVTIAVKNARFLRENGDVLASVESTVRTEQKRRNKAYQSCIVLSVGKFIKEFPENRDLVGEYIEVMRQVLTDDYVEDADLVSDGSPVQMEEFYLKYIRSVVDACPRDVFDECLFTFASELLTGFKNSGHEMSWRTCYSFNENFQALLNSWKSIDFTKHQLEMIAHAISILTTFTEMYKLEKNAIIFARNAKLSLDLFKRHNSQEHANQILEFVTRLSDNNVSSVVRNELEIAIA